MNAPSLSRTLVTFCGVCAIGCLVIHVTIDRAAAESGDSPKKSESTSEDPAVTDRPGIVADKPAGGFFVKTEVGYMVPYKATMPGSDIEFEMVPIPGGRFKLGSPETEGGRSENEGPQVDVEIPPFWMGKNEVTWAEYKRFMGLYDKLKKLQAARNQQKEIAEKIGSLAALKSLIDSDVSEVDAITVPIIIFIKGTITHNIT